MQTTYYLNTAELDTNFLDSLKNLFPNKKIEITVVESSDETDYLFENPANKDHLVKAAENVNSGNNLQEMDLKMLKQLIDE